MNYLETIEAVETIAKSICIEKKGSDGDGRIESAMREGPFLALLKERMLEEYPECEVVISPPRAPCDFIVNKIRINLKLTDCKSCDNSMNKPSLYYSITGLSNYPYSSTWNDFLEKLQTSPMKQTRERETEYHYLVKNKQTGDVLLKSIFDIHSYISNPSNDLQISWKNEFLNREYKTEDANYTEKIESLLICIQKSVQDKIRRTQKFAEADLVALLRKNCI